MTTAKNPAKPTGIASVRLTAALPKHGRLGVNPDELLTHPETTRYAIIEYDVASIIEAVDDHNRTAVIRILRLETLDDDGAATQAEQLLAQAATDRGAPDLFDDSDDGD